MKKPGFTNEQIAFTLKQVETGTNETRFANLIWDLNAALRIGFDETYRETDNTSSLDNHVRFTKHRSAKVSERILGS